MGGITRLYTDDVPRVDITAMNKAGLLVDGLTGTFESTRNGFKLWALNWKVTKESVRVMYYIDGEQLKFDIPTDNEGVYLGGDRRFLICPCCRNRRKQIYITASKFGCRVCLNLHYKCQSETSHKRNLRRLDRLMLKVTPIESNLGSRMCDYGKIKQKHYSRFDPVHQKIKLTQAEITFHIQSRFISCGIKYLGLMMSDLPSQSDL